MLVFDIIFWFDDRMVLVIYGEDKIYYFVEYFRFLFDKNDFKFDVVL